MNHTSHLPLIDRHDSSFPETRKTPRTPTNTVMQIGSLTPRAPFPTTWESPGTRSPVATGTQDSTSWHSPGIPKSKSRPFCNSSVCHPP